jgi:GntR family negative regulator for fad regulon and positive regulator of fabA
MENQKYHWETPRRPAELTEDRLVTAILDGTFPINSALPSERELAEQLGVTRPTLREALQRLSRDGWVEIHHGKTTRVRDYWREGNLLILSAMARHRETTQVDFVTQLLEVRRIMAPEYARLAIENNPAGVSALLEELLKMEDSPTEFSRRDFDLHKQMTVLSGNPIYTLILNGFGDLYQEMGKIYFANPAAREASRAFYRALRAAILANDDKKAYEVVSEVMLQSIDFWKAASHPADLGKKESD